VDIVELPSDTWIKLGILPRRSSRVVHLYCRLGCAEMRPRKNCKAKIDGRGIECIDSVGEVEPQILAAVQLARLGDQPVSQLRVDPPVAPFIGVGQRRAAHRIAKTHGIELRRLRRQTGLDSAGLSIGQLSERHRPVLLGARQCPNSPGLAIARHNPRNVSTAENPSAARKRLATVHRPTPRKTVRKKSQIAFKSTHQTPETIKNQAARFAYNFS